jgi:hypothetical protein
MLDKKLVESACKKYILTAVMESDKLSKKLTLEDHTALCERVLEMKYHEVLPLAFGGEPLPTSEAEGMRDYEDKFKRALKYGLAGTAGSYATRKAVGKATGRRLTGVGSGAMHPFAKSKWHAIGAGIGMAAYYLYRKLSDPCRAKAAMATGTPGEKAVIKHQCQAEASKRVIAQLNSQLGKCDETKNPEKCKSKIQKEIVVWKKRLQNELISLAKAKRQA